jgi:hypothetical protein
MIFANNAVYCPSSTAIDATGIDNSTFSSNYITGRLIGATLDGSTFCNGGTIEAAFTASAEHDYWPKPDSILINQAYPDFAPKLDFNHNPRCRPFDVGAYESDAKPTNPGWHVKSGFKPHHTR